MGLFLFVVNPMITTPGHRWGIEAGVTMMSYPISRNRKVTTVAKIYSEDVRALFVSPTLTSPGYYTTQ